MMKRLFSMLAVLLFVSLWMLPFTAASAQEGLSGNPLVVDEAGYLSTSEQVSLETQARNISEAHACEVVILTAKSFNGKSAQKYAEDYFVDHKYGWGEKINGILMLYSEEEEALYFATFGSAIQAFTDDGIDFLMDRVSTAYHEKNTYQAFVVYLEYSNKILGVSDNTLPESEADALDEEFDAFMGKTEKKPNYVKKGIVSAALGAAVGFVPVGISKSGLKTVRKKRDASTYLRQNGFNLNMNQDIYLYSNVASRVIQTQPPRSSGSGGHSISSGTSTTHTHSSGITVGGHGGKL